MRRLCMVLIRFYQRTLSRLKPYPTCRFTPTCSQYALEAFEKRGFFAGLALTLWRILRCSPLSPCGYDPVPEKGFRTMPLRWSKYDRPQTTDDPQEADDPQAIDDPQEAGSPSDTGTDKKETDMQRPEQEEPHP
ncbi:MAG: membrane protein insertion efficiency factor YidD [Eubacteriales bacterium]